MLRTRTYRWRDPPASVIGLSELRGQGLTPRGLLFVALDAHGEICLAVPEDLNEVTRIRVGDKLSLEPPWEGRTYHLDAVQRLPAGAVLWNGDRRLSQPGSMTELVFGLAEWIKGFGAKSVFLGCTPHQPGSWWAPTDTSPPVALHERGLVDVVTSATGLLARRIGSPALHFIRHGALSAADPADGWTPVFESPLGNILLLERRVLGDRLVLTCERGLVEVDVGPLPGPVRETTRVEMSGGFGVVGRFDGGAFAVTKGRVEPWGLADVAPALLVGASGVTILELAQSLKRAQA